MNGDTTADSRKLPEAARSALLAGNKIEAIKVVRKEFGLDLKDSKDFVEGALLQDAPLKMHFESSAQSSGLFFKILAFLAVLAAGYFAMR